MSSGVENGNKLAVKLQFYLENASFLQVLQVFTPVSRNIEFSTVGPKFELCLKPVGSFKMTKPTCLKILQFCQYKILW